MTIGLSNKNVKRNLAGRSKSGLRVLDARRYILLFQLLKQGKETSRTNEKVNISPIDSSRIPYTGTKNLYKNALPSQKFVVFQIKNKTRFKSSAFILSIHSHPSF
jgi:hypothetical protein